ncbi:MAG: hypothetical protein MJ245_02020 [Clostridia bacterium]|nr:hypothetical protein [Clostridia bacterium]
MLKQIYKKIIVTSLGVAFVTVLVHFFVKQISFDLLNALIGVAGGMLLAVVRFKLLYNSIEKYIDQDKTVARNTSITGYVGRYILTAVFLIGAVLYSLETFVTMAVTVILSTEIGARLSVPQNGKKGGNEGDGQ